MMYTQKNLVKSLILDFDVFWIVVVIVKILRNDEHPLKTWLRLTLNIFKSLISEFDIFWIVVVIVEILRDDEHALKIQLRLTLNILTYFFLTFWCWILSVKVSDAVNAGKFWLWCRKRILMYVFEIIPMNVKM